MMQDITELVVTIPALLLLLHYVSPAVRGLSDKSLREQWQFGIIPALYYVFDYFTIVYTNLFLQVVNDCKAPIKFQNGIPVSDMEGHGIGVRSICAIVQRYGGVFSFAEKDGKFTLRLSL